MPYARPRRDQEEKQAGGGEGKLETIILRQPADDHRRDERAKNPTEPATGHRHGAVAGFTELARLDLIQEIHEAPARSETYDHERERDGVLHRARRDEK